MKWHAVSGGVVAAQTWSFRLEDLNQHDVQLDALHAHPAERRQEEIVQETGDDGTQDLTNTRTHLSDVNLCLM